MAAKKKSAIRARTKATKKSGKGVVKTTGKSGSKSVVVKPPKAKKTSKKGSRKPKPPTSPKQGMGVPTRVGSEENPAVVVNPPSDD